MTFFPLFFMPQKNLIHIERLGDGGNAKGGKLAKILL
jgi:hypothetical protein